MTNGLKELKGKYILNGKLLCVTGLHIGGTAQGIEIGGMDNPVIRDPLTDMPYIPGSSLKGKLRSLLEWSLDKIESNPQHETKDKKVYGAHFCGECPACVLFGSSAPETKEKMMVKVKVGPTRLTVRDLFPTGYLEHINGKKIPPESTVYKWQEWLGKEIYTELKTENSIDRVTSEATPRSMERVPAGSEFVVEMIVDIYQKEDTGLFSSLFTAMHLLENTALGGSGSRGHGQVSFKDISLRWRSVDFYHSGQGELVVDLHGKTTPQDLCAEVSRITLEPQA